MNDIYIKILTQKVKRAYREIQKVYSWSELSESPTCRSSGRAEPLKKGEVVRIFRKQGRAPWGWGRGKETLINFSIQ